MKRLLWVTLSLVLLLSAAALAQNSNTSTNGNKTNSTRNANANRKPIFRASADQIKQAQGMLKQRNFYSGDQTGKLDTATRAGLKQYQQAEGLKITSTLNNKTPEKIEITTTH